MKEFTALDDSLVYEKGIFVYTHAIVSSDTSEVIAFSGSKDEIYQNTKEIEDFVLTNLQGDLYACGHYRKYPHIWDKVTSSTSDKYLPKLIHNAAIQAHHLAKSEAKSKLAELLK